MTYPVGTWCGVPVSMLPAYHYDVFASAGVYIFVRRDMNGEREALYVGESSRLSNRLGTSHEKWFDAVSMGMNEIHVNLTATTPRERLIVERHLRHALLPPLNQQLDVDWMDLI